MTVLVQINHQPGELKMKNCPDQNSPKRSDARRSSRFKQLRKQHGVTLCHVKGALAAQQGKCGCCGKKLGRAIHVDHKKKRGIGRLCTSCVKLVANIEHIREYARAFEAFFMKHGMTAQLALHHELMAIWRMKPAQEGAVDGAGGRPA
jgi:hypothetical protein